MDTIDVYTSLPSTLATRTLLTGLKTNLELGEKEISVSDLGFGLNPFVWGKYLFLDKSREEPKYGDFNYSRYGIILDSGGIYFPFFSSDRTLGTLTRLAYFNESDHSNFEKIILEFTDSVFLKDTRENLIGRTATYYFDDTSEGWDLSGIQTNDLWDKLTK